MRRPARTVCRLGAGVILLALAILLLRLCFRQGNWARGDTALRAGEQHWTWLSFLEWAALDLAVLGLCLISLGLLMHFGSRLVHKIFAAILPPGRLTYYQSYYRERRYRGSRGYARQ